MRAYAYVGPGRFELLDKPRPELRNSRDAIVRVTLGSICTSDLHIKHGSVPRAVPGVTVGHEMVGVVTVSHPSGPATGWRSMSRRSAASAFSAGTAT